MARYWVRHGKRLRGPLEPSQLGDLPGFGELSLVCPERRNRKDRRNWTLARDCPEVLAALQGPRGAEKFRAFVARRAAESPRPAPGPTQAPGGDDPAPGPRPRAPRAGRLGLAAAVAVAAAALAALLMRPAERGVVPVPAGPPASARPRAESPFETAARTYLPACDATLADAAGLAVRVAAGGGGRRRLAWQAPWGELEFELDLEDGSLTPLNAASRSLFDNRTPCPAARRP